MSTVHVIDVCRALWHLTSHGSSGDVFNLADKSDTCKTFNPQNMIVNSPFQWLQIFLKASCKNLKFEYSHYLLLNNVWILWEKITC